MKTNLRLLPLVAGLALLASGCMEAQAGSETLSVGGHFFQARSHADDSEMPNSPREYNRIDVYSGGPMHRRIATMDPHGALIVVPGLERDALRVCMDGMRQDFERTPDDLVEIKWNSTGDCLMYDRRHPPAIDRCGAWKDIYDRYPGLTR